MDNLVLVTVVWADAHASAGDQLTVKELDDYHKPTIMETTGWLLREDDVGVTVANERCLDEGDGAFRGRTFIPKSLIQSITPVIKSKKPRKPKAAPVT
jgi:hypothetical protein